MKFSTITIENFMAIGTAAIKLADRGLVLIQGENDAETSSDSNGAGKSSIADALSWCLYGTTARGESGDDIVNNETGKDCRVQVIIEDGDAVYTVTRFRKHKTGKNTLLVVQTSKTHGLITELTKGTEKLTQIAIEQIIGCSHEVFCGAVYAGQERMPDLPGMTDKQLKVLIEEASGATLLETAYAEANKKVTGSKADLQIADLHLARANQQLDDATRALAETNDNRIAFEERRKAEILLIGSNAKARKLMVESKTDELSKMGDAVLIRQRIEALDKQIAGVASEQDQDRKNTDLAAVAQSDHTKEKLALSGAKRQLDVANSRLLQLDHQVGCPCSTCDRPFSAEDIDPAKKIAAAEVETAESAYSVAKDALTNASLALSNALQKRDDYRASMTDLSRMSAARAANQTKLDEIRAAETSLAAEKTALRTMIDQMKDKKTASNPFDGDIAKYTTLIADRADQVGDFMVEQTKAQVAQQVAEQIAKVFSPTGVRAFLLDEVTPFLNDQTAKYLGTLSDGHITATWTTLVKTAKGELREKFSIEVENANGGKKFGLVSGGEKRKVRIACALALQDLVARRATKPIELFIGDEIDDALDRAGQERLIQILEEKSKERGSVFIISHADLKDWIRTQITVKRTGARAIVEEVVA